MAASLSNHAFVDKTHQQHSHSHSHSSSQSHAMSTSSSTTNNSSSPSHHHSKSKKAGKKHNHSHSHNHNEPHHSQLSYEELSNIRVRQKNLVYVVGLPIHLCDEQTLKKKSWFGRFGKIKKVYCNKKTAHAARTGSCAAFITFHREKDAMNAIAAMNGKPLDDGSRRIIKATTGSTKYCSYFLRGSNCSNPNCLYLHDWAHKEDVVTKEELNDFGPIHHGTHSTYSSLNSININVLNSSSSASAHHHLHHNGSSSSTPSASTMAAALSNSTNHVSHGQALRLSFDSRSDGTHSLNYLDDDENNNNSNNHTGHEMHPYNEYDESSSSTAAARLRSSSYHEMNTNRTVLSTTLSKPKSTTAATIAKFDYTRVVKKGILNNQEHQALAAAHSPASHTQTQTHTQSQSPAHTATTATATATTATPSAATVTGTPTTTATSTNSHNQNHAQSHIENHNQNAQHTVDYPEFPPLGASIASLNSNNTKTPPVRPQKHRTKPPMGHPQHSKSKRQQQTQAQPHSHGHTQQSGQSGGSVAHKHSESKSEKLSAKNGNHIQPEKQPPKISLDDSQTHRASNHNNNARSKHSHSHSHSHSEQQVKFDNLVDIVSGDSSEIYIESKVDVKKSSTSIRSKSSDANRRQRNRDKDKDKDKEQPHKTLKTQKTKSTANANAHSHSNSGTNQQRKTAIPSSSSSSSSRRKRSRTQSHRAVAQLLLKELLNNQMKMNQHQHSVSRKLSDLLPDGMLTLDELRMDDYNYCYFLQSDHLIFEQFHKLFHHLNARKLQKSKA